MAYYEEKTTTNKEETTMFNLFSKEKTISGDIILNTQDYNEYMWFAFELGKALLRSYTKSVIDPYDHKKFIVEGSNSTSKLGFKTTEKALKNINKEYVVGYSIIVR